MFRRPTVDGVLAVLNKSINDLGAVIDVHTAVSVAASAEIERQTSIMNDACGEIARAQRVRSRLNELLS